MLFFAVIVLIGTGWSYMKPFLTDRDRQIMLAVMVGRQHCRHRHLSILLLPANVANVACSLCRQPLT